MLLITIVCILAGIGAGLGTGFAGISAATVISPMLITLLGVPSYQAIGVALASDVLASAVSAMTYARNKHVDILNALAMLISVLIMTAVGSFLASFVPNTTMGSLATIMTIFLGLKFLIKPSVPKSSPLQQERFGKRIGKALLAGIYIGFICGFVGAGGGLMMLFVLTSILGYELKNAVGTSVFVMTFTAFTGAVSHILLSGIPSLYILFVCILSTLIAAQIGALIANRADNRVLNRCTGGILTDIGVSMTAIQLASRFL